MCAIYYCEDTIIVLMTAFEDGNFIRFMQLLKKCEESVQSESNINMGEKTFSNIQVRGCELQRLKD